MELRHFLERLGAGLDADAFAARYPEPFLVDPDEAAGDARRIFRLSAASAGAILVGRNARCHVALREPLVSSRHAELRAPSGPLLPWRVVDCRSTNGTRVDGERLEPGVPAPVVDGTLLTFADVELRFLSSATLFPRLPRPTGGDAGVRPTEHFRGVRRPRPVRREPAPSEALLLFCSPFDPVALEDGRPVVVGRRADVADLVLHSEDVSRRHAEFERRGDEVFVRDLESANGTFLNGEQVSGSWKRMDLEGFVSIGSWQLLVGTPPTSTGKIPLPTSAAEAQGEPLRGELADRSVVELLRQVEDEAVSGVLEVSGPTSGRISFVDGLPWSASAGDGSTGVAAIEVLLGVRVGAFALSPEGPQDEPRQIVATSGELLAQLGG